MEQRLVPHGACGGPEDGLEAWGQAHALPDCSGLTLWHSFAPSAAAPQERPRTGDLAGDRTRVKVPLVCGTPFPTHNGWNPDPSTHSS